MLFRSTKRCWALYMQLYPGKTKYEHFYYDGDHYMFDIYLVGFYLTNNPESVYTEEEIKENIKRNMEKFKSEN